MSKTRMKRATTASSARLEAAKQAAKAAQLRIFRNFLARATLGTGGAADSAQPFDTTPIPTAPGSKARAALTQVLSQERTHGH